MASNMPIPIPPRTPTPPPEDDHHLAFDDDGDGNNTPRYDSNLLSPEFDSSRSASGRNLGLGLYGDMGTPASPGSHASSSPSIYSPMSAEFGDRKPSLSGSENTAPARNPFNFQTQAYTLGKPGVATPRSDVGRRRGHKYKHSSIHHQIILEPPPRPPLQLPTSLPIPTPRECWRSMSREQRSRGLWCACHFFVAIYVQASARGSMALTALGHLLFYDACGAFLCVAVDVGTNFEVWKRSSLSYPFGLERAEVLAGMAMSVMMLFEGLDLLSHGLTHALENVGGHEAHHAHSHEEAEERGSTTDVDIAAVAAVAVTLVSAIVLKNHARIGKVMRFAYIDSLPSVLSNPSHFLTLSCSVLLLTLPTFGRTSYIWVDRALSFFIAAAMIAFGLRLGRALGKILLMTYSGPGVDTVIRAIESDPLVSAVDEAKFWQVHYGLCQANLKLRIRNMADMERVREKISTLIKSRLGGGYGSGGQRWEVSTQLTLERD